MALRGRLLLRHVPAFRTRSRRCPSLLQRALVTADCAFALSQASAG